MPKRITSRNMSTQRLTFTPVVRVFDACPEDGKIYLNDQGRKHQHKADRNVFDEYSSSSQSTNSDEYFIRNMSPAPDGDTIIVASSIQESEDQLLEESRASEDQASLERRVNFKYREEHHLTLYLLRTTFKGSWNQTTRVFNEVYQQDVTNYGLEKGPLRTALKTQFAYRHNSQSALWQAFRRESQGNRWAFTDIKNRIETALLTFNIPNKAITLKKKKKKIRRTCIKREEAHPPLPVVLFRAYNDASQGSNSSEGFVASHFEDHDGLPLPPEYSDHDLENAIRKHLSKHEDFKSPFISTSSCLIKVMRRAIKASEKAQDLTSCRIGIINTQKVGQGDVIFYARPYRELFRTKGVYPWRYSAEEEYLVWGSIPRKAILADLSLQGLSLFIAEDPVLSHAFDTDVSKGKVQEMCRTLKVQSADAWLAEAAVFAHSFIDSQDCVVVGHEEKYFAAISEAFLAGARTSTKSWIAHIELNQDHAQDMVDRAVRVGLLSAEEKFSRSTVH
ncbi:uncharacterized protein M437DRAFT_62259 [Aureobasidium melanogenum CBS 110374]|uniref:DUF7587 domain-containing protein n=1 Tax=Aureobasidium melanogenum (strain CBS 110374) TaxID=1043003 RepID=A0A074W417_AURM1|nr:uncharacterized protein M437DRAFT_62259 [Aureobasidium melanogenum CBS 110374]KEQ67895.1 hypothetical protein M437DRAFT_62259 [Aureobasidium melanogenum CBS 110374]